MPTTFNDAAPVDYVKYFTDQLPQDLAKLAALRDELALRQGNIDAVKKTAELKEQAKKELDEAKAEAAQLKAEAKADAAEASAKKKAQDAREKELTARIADFDKQVAAQATAAAQKDKVLVTREEALTKQAAHLQALQQQLDRDRADLDARVKAFQAKVAALTV